MKNIIILLIFFLLISGIVLGSEKSLNIDIYENAAISSLRPVTGGVPIAEGSAPEGTRFMLFDNNNKPVPLQTSILGRWKDGSARWILLDFQAAPPANGELNFKLSWGEKSKTVNPKKSVFVSGRKKPTIKSGSVNEMDPKSQDIFKRLFV